MEIENRVFLVTGASSGIGLAAMALASRNAGHLDFGELPAVGRYRTDDQQRQNVGEGDLITKALQPAVEQARQSIPTGNTQPRPRKQRTDQAAARGSSDLVGPR